MTIADFLLARIEEDETRARKLALTDNRPVLSLAATVNHPERLLAEAQTKRAIIASAEGHGGQFETILRTLAAIYSDHPDYNTAWRDE